MAAILILILSHGCHTPPTVIPHPPSYHTHYHTKPTHCHIPPTVIPHPLFTILLVVETSCTLLSNKLYNTASRFPGRTKNPSDTILSSSCTLTVLLRSFSNHITLLGAHGTGQFFVRVVRWAGKASAGSLSVVEQSTIFITSTAWYALWVHVHALKGCSVMGSVLCHEVAIVLESPGGWTLGFGREHQDCFSTRRRHTAQGTL